MVAQTTTEPADLLTPSLDERWLALETARGWRSQLGLVVAVVAHLLVAGLATGAFDGALRRLFGAGQVAQSSADRPIGDKAGTLDGVAAEIIDAAEFNKRFISFDPGRGEADSRPEPESKAQDAQPENTPPRPEVELKTATDTPGDGWAPVKPAVERAKPQPEASLSEAEMRELLAQTMEDLQGAAVAVSTPGAARQGEASPYVRGVIRTLKANMPRPGRLKGTVVIQLVVANAGGVEAVRIVRSSGIEALDRLVAEGILKTRLAAPPETATQRERVFQISYEYR